MAINVDLNDPDGAPVSGVFTSDSGGVFIGDLEVIKVEEATLRIDNNLRQQRPVGTKIANNYAGNLRITGSITRAHLNLAEMRLVMGSQPGAELKTVGLLAGAGVLTSTQLAELLQTKVLPYAGEGLYADDHFYPLRANVSLIVNRTNLAPKVDEVTLEEENDEELAAGLYTRTTYRSKLLTINANNCLFGNLAIGFNSTGFITSGPLNFMGGHIQWLSSENIIDTIFSPSTPSS